MVDNFSTVFRTFLKSKIHRAVITAAAPDYEGSITIDRAVCRAAGLLAFEQVDVYDITNGARFTTYVIYGAAGEIQVNGAAARLVAPGDLIIVAGYCRLAENEISAHRARVVLMGPGNSITGSQDHAVTPP
jgi:aspartate 1-decarboxylase